LPFPAFPLLWGEPSQNDTYCALSVLTGILAPSNQKLAKYSGSMNRYTLQLIDITELKSAGAQPANNKSQF
jgi:hypothetical protein